MSDTHSTTPASGGKPAKPYPEFPLFAHAAGVWAKKIRGKMHYFGPWSDPDGSLRKYLKQKDDLHAGKASRTDPNDVTVKDVVNAFLNAKQAQVDSGELSPRTWIDYKDACDLMIARFGKGRVFLDLGPSDFAALRNQLAERWGPCRLKKTIQCVRTVVKYACDAEMVDRPVRVGPTFKPPSKKTMRLHRAERGPNLFTADEVRRLIEAAGQPLRAMILLGINCGMGNSDVGNLPLTALDLDGAWLNYPRPKTGIARRCPLWPETALAVRAALAQRPTPRDPEFEGLAFLLPRGRSWHTGTNDNPLSTAMSKLLRSLGINGRNRLNFYTLRHTHRTVTDEARDQPAADHIMGHETGHMSAADRERISDARLKAVSDHVRKWLFGDDRV
jgi:integrase